jgi:hypothetical protein
MTLRLAYLAKKLALNGALLRLCQSHERFSRIYQLINRLRIASDLFEKLSLNREDLFGWKTRKTAAISQELIRIARCHNQ